MQYLELMGELPREKLQGSQPCLSLRAARLQDTWVSCAPPSAHPPSLC